MSEDLMLKCLIAFILGWFLSRQMGNGFSVGGEKNKCNPYSDDPLDDTLGKKCSKGSYISKECRSGICGAARGGEYTCIMNDCQHSNAAR